MPPFTVDEAQTLVQQHLSPMNITLPAAVVQQAWQGSQGHPGKLQQALREVLNKVIHHA